MKIIKSKATAKEILKEQEVRYYDPFANGCGGWVSIWIWEGDYFTYAEGRGWWSAAPTLLGDLKDATALLWRDRKLWNDSERERSKEERIP